MSGNNDEDKKGFSGLSDLVSDIDDFNAKPSIEPTPHTKPSQTTTSSIVNETEHNAPLGNNGKDKKGFSGLSDLTSDSSTGNDVPEPEPSTPSPKPDHRATPPIVNETERNDPVTPKSIKTDGGGDGNLGSGLAWILVTVGILFLYLLVVNNGNHNTNNIPNNPPQSAQIRDYPQSSSLPATLPRTIETTRLQYEKPPVGNSNNLSLAQICWCLREDVRIKTIREIISSRDEVNEFNKIIFDYDQRCRSFRYSSGSLENARRQVEASRSQIVAEALNDAKYLGHKNYPNSLSISPGKPINDVSKDPAPLLTKEAQRLLTALGYDPGPSDGQPSIRTMTAVKSFQRDIGQSPDGRIDDALMISLRKMKTDKGVIGASTQERLPDNKKNSLKNANEDQEKIQKNQDNTKKYSQMSIQTTSSSLEIPSSGSHFAVQSRQQLIEKLMQILSVSYSQKVEISFSYAGEQIPLRINRIDSGKGKPILVDFGSLYGDAVLSIEKAGYIVIQILNIDTVYKGVSKLLNVLGVPYSKDLIIQMTGQPPVKIPGIWTERSGSANLFLTEVVLNPEMIQSVQKKGINIMTLKRNAG